MEPLSTYLNSIRPQRDSKNERHSRSVVHKKQIAEGKIEGFGQENQVQQADIASASLHIAEVVSVESCCFGQALLCKTALKTKRPEPVAEPAQEIELLWSIGRFHWGFLVPA